MARRPIFVPNKDIPSLVEDVYVDFKWHPGFALIQKSRNIQALHEAGRVHGLERLLEISTKSEDQLGASLSAFRLELPVDGIGMVPIECIFQGGKLFADGGPYVDLYTKEPRDAKRDQRLIESGPLIGFTFGQVIWELEPKTAFYDWLYLRAASRIRGVADQLSMFEGFTDIEFNPKKSVNCQARSCALFVSLEQAGLLQKAIQEPKFLVKVLGTHSTVQADLL